MHYRELTWVGLRAALSVSALRTGRAFGIDRDQWTWGGLVAMRIAF